MAKWLRAKEVIRVQYGFKTRYQNPVSWFTQNAKTGSSGAEGECHDFDFGSVTKPPHCCGGWRGCCGLVSLAFPAPAIFDGLTILSLPLRWSCFCAHWSSIPFDEITLLLPTLDVHRSAGALPGLLARSLNR